MKTKQRTARIELRCAPEERSEWEALARRAGCSLSSYIRRSLGKSLPSASADPVLIRQLAGIGNNLNQLTRWANIHKQGLESSLVLDVLLRVQEELAVLRRDRL